MKKGINKGFSLVELIVVVLIMAIIAVVLAPQVTKWVQNSREAKDLQTLSSMTEYAQLAMTDAEAYADANRETIKISFDSTGCTVTGQSDIEDFAKKLGEVAGVEAESKNGKKEYRLEGISKKSDSSIEIEIKDGVVTPSSDIENDDLEVSAVEGTPSKTPTAIPSSGPSEGEEPSSTLSINYEDYSLEKGESFVLEATGSGKVSFNVTAGSDKVSTRIDDNKCTVTGARKGEATIEVSMEGSSRKMTCKVTVNESFTYSISLSQESAELEVGETTSFEATVSPTTAKVQWGMSAEDQKKGVIELNPTTGEIKAVKEGTVTVIAKIMEIAEQKTASIVITVTKAAPATRTIKHIYKKGNGPKDEVEICTESVSKGVDKTYTSTKTSTYDNLQRKSTNISFTAADKDTDLKIEWEAKSGWGTKFGAGKTVDHGNNNKNTYAGSIVIDGTTYAVFNGENDLKKIQYWGEDVNLTDENDKPNKTCYVYVRDKQDGVVTLTRYKSNKSNNQWSWSKDGTTYTIFITK